MEYENANNVNKGKIIQYSAVLFIIGSTMAYFVGSTIMGINEVYMDVMYFFGLISLAIVHEISHYVGFLLLGRLKPSEIKLVILNTNEFPYFVPKLEIDEKRYAYVRLFPAITCTLCGILIMYGAGNLGLFGLAGVGLGLSGGDLHLARISRRIT
jgi:dolichyl-phosphate-mannose--protein O-mannosyl transferase